MQIMTKLIFPLIFSGFFCAQQFEVKPSAVEVNPGDSALLTCKVHNRQGECAWLKDGKVMGRIDTKYEFLREPADGDCSIRIRNAKIEEDDGMWQCQVTQISLTEPTLTAPDVKFTVRGKKLRSFIFSATIIVVII